MKSSPSTHENTLLRHNLVTSWGGYGTYINDEIFFSKLGLRDLFHPFVKPPVYSTFYLTPNLFRDGHFLSRDILIAKKQKTKKKTKNNNKKTRLGLKNNIFQGIFNFHFAPGLSSCLIYPFDLSCETTLSQF